MLRSQRSAGWFTTVSALSLGAVLLAASWCPAQEEGQQRRGQRGGGPGGFGAGPAALIGNERVQAALELTDEQKAVITELRQSTVEASRERLTGLRDLPEEQRRERMREQQQKAAAEFEAALNDVLTEQQQKRFEQIQLQLRGNRALLDPEVAAKLNLTEEQQGKIRQVFEEQAAQFRRPEGEERRRFDPARFAEARREAEARINDVLTSEQKAAWAELTGPRVEINLRGGFQGRGQRGGFQRGEGRRGEGGGRRPGGRRRPQ